MKKTPHLLLSSISLEQRRRKHEKNINVMIISLRFLFQCFACCCFFIFRFVYDEMIDDLVERHNTFCLFNFKAHTHTHLHANLLSIVPYANFVGAFVFFLAWRKSFVCHFAKKC